MSRKHMKNSARAIPSSASHLPRFSPAYLGRKRSIILDGDDASQNVIINPDLLKLHKNRSISQNGVSVSNSMTDEEFSWWSNPFLRMLSSPLRMCILTRRYAPKDHLIRLTATLAPGTNPPTSSAPAFITPTDLHHPRYASRPEGLGAYVACSKNGIQLLSSKGRHRGIFPGAEIHSLLGDQITAGLRARCVEEAELLAGRIRTGTRLKQGEDIAIAVRRLTLNEYEAALKQNLIEDPKAVAVLVVPKPDLPPNPSAVTEQSRMLLRGLAISTPHTTTESGPALPAPRIPMYFWSNLVHDQSLLALLRKALDSALSGERIALRRARESLPGIRTFMDMPYEPKAKDAYALCASRRVDVVPLAIALWRLRLWMGE